LVLLLLLGSTPLRAAITVYTNESDFVSAIGILPTFVNDLAALGDTNSTYPQWLAHTVKGSSNGISYYVASSPPIHLMAFSGALSTLDTNDQIDVTFTSGNVTGAGGYLYSGDTNAVATDGVVTITLSDGTTTNVPTASGAAPPFTGFLSDGPLITSLSITNSSGAGFPTLAHFYAVDGIPGISMTVTLTNSLVISWYCQPTGFVVQASSRPFGGTWTNLNLTPKLVGTQFQTVVPIGGSAGFFRLKK
jgi:hypothetical protein